MKIYYIFFATCLFLTHFTQAQQQDFIVSLSGDTIRGSIKNIQNDQLRLNASGTESYQSYHAQELVVFGLENGNLFKPVHLPGLQSNATPTFVQVLVWGKASLYKFKDRLYLQKENGPVHPLENNTYERTINQHTTMVKGEDFKVLLNNELSHECAALKEQVDRSRLTQKAMVELVIEYNKCKGSDFAVTNENKSWFTLSPGFYAGLGIHKFNSNAEFEIFEELTELMPAANSLVVGTLFQFSSPRATSRWAFVAGVSYTYFESSSTFIKNPNNWPTEYYLDFAYSQLQVPIGGKYILGRGKLRPYLNGGLAVSFHFNHEMNMEYKLPTSEEPSPFSGITMSYSGTLVGFWGGFGLDYPIGGKTLFLESRWDGSLGITNSEMRTVEETLLFRGKTNSIQFIIGFRL